MVPVQIGSLKHVNIIKYIKKEIIRLDGENSNIQINCILELFATVPTNGD